MEMTTAQAAKAVGMTDQTLRNHVTAGRLRARRHGIRGLYRVREEDLREFSEKYRYPIVEEALQKALQVG